MKGKPRSRIVTISKIYEKPKERKVGDYSYFSYGIKLEDGTYANINISAKTEEEAIEKAIPYQIVDQKTKERIVPGETYNLFEESTDEDEKYWRVKAFVKQTTEVESVKDPNLGSDAELVQDAPKGTTKEVIHKESSGEVGGPTSYQDREERKQTLIVRQSAINYATQLATVFLTWRLKEKDIDLKQEWDMWEKSIKALAKEYEEQILRSEK